jgi:CRISPR-associated exonuclease Cas4
MVRVTGGMINYYFVCKRKLWLSKHGINLEAGNEDVKLGKLLDEESFGRHKSNVLVDGTINIDFIRKDNTIHETKKSKAIDEASIWQLKYYLYYLKLKGIENLKGIIHYPLLNKKVEVILEKNDDLKIESLINNIEEIVTMKKPPEVKMKKICKKCAYYEMCFS